MIRVAIVDHHSLYRKSLETLLNSFGNICVVFDAGSGEELVDKLRTIPVDIVLIDILMEDADGMIVCQTLKQQYPDIHFLVLSQMDERKSISKMIRIGMSGFFSKDSEPIRLNHVISSIMQDGFYFENKPEPAKKQNFIQERGKQKETNKESISITLREMEIIRLACKEYSSSEIADILNINVRTVETHRKRMIQKTKARNFIGVILFALKNDLLVLESV